MATSNRFFPNCENPRHGHGHGHEHGHGQDFQPVPTSYNRDQNICGYAFFDTVKIRFVEIGRVIGNGGLNIRSVQNHFHVRVKIDKKNLIVSVHGNSRSDVENACNYILEKIDLRRELFALEGKSLTLPPLVDWNAVHKKSEEALNGKWSNFYLEKDEVAGLSAAEVGRMRSENNIMASLVFEGNKAIEIPNPIWTFEQCFDVYPDLLAKIKKQGFTKPTPIQAQAWPILLKGHDMIGISHTGSGKSLAFLLPALIHTENQGTQHGQRGGPDVIVLVPNRAQELRLQDVFNKYQFRNIKSVCDFSGECCKPQINCLEPGAEIIISTPGRLIDLIEAKNIDVTSVTLLIIDEVDRMLKMGFDPKIRKIIKKLRPDRQTVVTSANWPPYVRKLAHNYMNNPIQVCIRSMNLAAILSIKQVIKIKTGDNEKNKSVKAFIDNMTPKDKAIIFCECTKRVDVLSINLSAAGYKIAFIHSDREQHDREYALFEIQTGISKILVTTDIASHGLDIEDLTYVFHYDMPNNIEDYVQRVGLTGHAERTGTSIAYLTRRDSKMAHALIQILNESNQRFPDELQHMAINYKVMQKRRAFCRGNRLNGNNVRVSYS